MNPAGASEDIRRRIVQRSTEDDNFRAQLLRDPKATIEQEVGVSLPAEIEICVVEETAQTVYLVLPTSTPAPDTSHDELSDRDLENVAGGWTGGSTDGANSCNDSCNHYEVTICACG